MDENEHSSRSEHTGHVLLIDDDDSVRHVLRLGLEAAGFEVQEAATELEVHRRLKRRRPDALLLDLQRSSLDGVELLLHLRARQTLQAMPIVFLTTCDDDDFRQHVLRAGADWLGVRPLGRSKLQAQLADLIRNGRRARVLADHDVGQLAWHDDDPLYRAGGQVRLNTG